MLRRNWMMCALVPMIACAFTVSAQEAKKDEPKKPAEAPKAAEVKNIVDTAKGAGNFKTLVELLDTAGLTETLKGTGPFTVFAPTDEAFAKVAKADLEGLKKDKAKLAGVLKYHVHGGKMMAADVSKAKEVKTIEGASLKVTVKDGKVMVDTANVTKTDIACSNGVIHVIDAVVMPPAKAEKKPEPKPEPKKEEPKKPAGGGR